MSRQKRKVKDVSLNEFRTSTSLFRSEEMKALNISFDYTDDFSNILKSGFCDQFHHELSLEGFDYSRIISYTASEDDNLTTIQRKFLRKLKMVLINNNLNFLESSDERYVDDLLVVLLDSSGFDDGLELVLEPCKLRLTVGAESFAAIADKEGRRGTELTWIIQEDKHQKSSTFLHGDLQLACAIIAAFQSNNNLLGEIYPDIILGVKVVGDLFFFCSISIDEEYLEDLADGLPESSVVMHLYPKNGLRLSDVNDRGIILRILKSMRLFALTLRK